MFSCVLVIPYTIRVATGDKDEHTTEANAFITLIGTEGVSDKPVENPNPTPRYIFEQVTNLAFPLTPMGYQF